MDGIKMKDVNLLLLAVFPLTFLIAYPFGHILMFVIIRAWIGKNDLNFRDFLYLKRTKASIVFFSVLIGAFLALMNFFNHFYFRYNIELLGSNKFSLSLSNLWFLFTFCVFGPVIEELFFRGFLYNFYKNKGIFSAIILSSVFFSLTHFDAYRIIMIFIIGVFLALSYEITKCFWVPVLIHGSINMIHTFLVFEPIAGFLKELLYWIYGDNVLFFRLKLLLISIVLCILAILALLFIMHLSGNNIFKGKKFRNMIFINKDDDDPLIDTPLILVFVISIVIIVARVVFKQN
ncbi:MAG: CPBP family intramembrane metalloprotease [Firmicutes bacterium]|nr:CPBP family intramembrane metalloprotease [Bacillota bacterium]